MMLEILQTWRYYANYPKDPAFLKYLVGFLLLNSIECMFGNFVYVYMVSWSFLTVGECVNIVSVLRHVLGSVSFLEPCW